MSNIFPLLKEYIGNDKVEEAVNLMLEFLRFRDESMYDDLLLLKNRYKRYVNEYQMGLITDRTEYMQIVRALQNKVNEAEDMEFPQLEEKQQEDHTSVIAAVYANVYGTQAADVDLVVQTTHPENPTFEETCATLASLFEQVPDLEYQVKELNVEQHEENYAVVRVRQRTLGRAVYPQFRDNECLLLHTLVPHQGRWKLYGTVISEIKFLT